VIGVRNSFSITTIVKTQNEISCVSRYSPEVSTMDTEKSLLNHLKLSSLTCAKLKTKFPKYASILWAAELRTMDKVQKPNSPDQICFSEVSDIHVAVAPASPRGTEKPYESKRLRWGAWRQLFMQHVRAAYPSDVDGNRSNIGKGNYFDIFY
jgi:hypothetical protein